MAIWTDPLTKSDVGLGNVDNTSDVNKPVSTAATAAFQPVDSDLTTIAGLTATTDSFLQAKASAWASRTVAQVKADLGITADVVTIGGLSPANDDVIQRKSGAWTNRTVAQYKTDLSLDADPFVKPYASVSADTTLTSAHHTVLVDSTAANRTITVPTAVGITGRHYVIKKKVAANTVTLATTSSQTIDGGTNFVLYDALATIELVSDGANWQVIGNKPVRTYGAQATSTLTLSTTVPDVAGASVTFTTASVSSLIVCEAQFDVEVTNTALSVVQLNITVDGTAQGLSYASFPSPTWRCPSPCFYRGSLSAGSHTIKLQGAKTVAAGAGVIYSGASTKILVTIYE